MNLRTFNEEAYHQLISEGYIYIEIKPRAVQMFSYSTDKELQILIAYKSMGQVPEISVVQQIDSEMVTAFLSRFDLDCFVIVKSEETIAAVEVRAEKP